MPDRVRALNDAPHGDGPVVYWMTSQRRVHWNHALDHAAQQARERGVGLVVLEALRADYPYACKRFHTFVAQGMQENQQACQEAGIAYHPFIEPEPGAGKGMLAAYAEHASLIVADDHPGFFFPRMLTAARLPVRIDAVDAIGLFPLRVTEHAYVSAYQFRRFLQKHLLPHLMERPAEVPASEGGEIPDDILDRWPATMEVPDVPDAPGEVDAVGGRAAAVTRLDRLASRIDAYPERNHPDADAQSGLSPYLHFGHIGAAEVVWRLLEQEDWHPGRIGDSKGQRAGWWGLSEGAEAFLDQIITWRELGHVEALHNADWRSYQGLPGWARETLEAHASDRTVQYDLASLEAAGTDDEVWNAAQRQLLQEGTIQNYLRMLWGKKVLQWAPDPPTAFDWLLHLNDKYALDGRDPNSVSGVAWCMGRYDRPWQEREVFGKVRTMTSKNTLRKLRMDAYMDRFGSAAT